MPRLDLHTHSVASPDGGLSEQHYRQMLASGGLDYIAVTDHNDVAFAIKLQQTLGERIIVGEEITTRQGDLIGLYLRERVPPGLTAREAARRIHSQGGLVYIPHPFDVTRSGIGNTALETLGASVDILEVYNGRAVFRTANRRAARWNGTRGLPAAASSDSHGRRGWGRTYTIIEAAPSRDTLCDALRHGSSVTKKAGVVGVLYPKTNRLRKKLKRRTQ